MDLINSLGSINVSLLDKEKRARECVFSFMKKSADYRKPYELNWEKCLNEYLNTKSVKANILQRANLKLPYAFTVIETFTPQIVEAFFGDKPYIQTQGVGVEDDYDAEAITQHTSYQLDRNKMLSKFAVFVKNYLVYGSAIVKNIWSTKNKGGRVIFDGVDTVNVPLEDFFPDWSSNQPGNIQDMRGCVHRVYRTLSEIKSKRKRVVNGRKVGIYSNVDKLEQSLDIKGDNAWVNMSRPADDPLSLAKERAYGQEAGVKTNDKIEIWEYWGEFDLSDDGEKTECLITIANGDIILRVDENPYSYKHKPFSMSVDYPVEGELYGIGEILPILSLIKEGTALRNARLDQTNQSVNRMWLVDRNSGINVRNLINRPGGVVLANDINGIKALDPAESSPAATRETSQIDYDIQNATANTNASQSVSNVGRAFGRTKAGIDFMQNTTSSRMVLKIRLIEEMLIKDLGWQYMLLNKQFLEDSQWRRLFGDLPNPYTKVDDESFCKEYDFIATGAMERLNKSQRQSNFAQVLIPFLQQANQMQPHTVKWDGVTTRMFKEFDWRNVDELVTTPEERQKLQQDDMIQQQQLEMHNQEMAMQAQAMLQNKAKDDKIELETTKSANKAGLQVVKGLSEFAFQGPKNSSRGKGGK